MSAIAGIVALLVALHCQSRMRERLQSGARGFITALIALTALWWPARIPGLLDGAPLDGGVEAVLLGLIVPVLCWFHNGFLRQRAALVMIAALALLKVADAQMTQGGWCVRFDPPGPIVRDQTGRPHSWDVRADWRSPDPQCSAILATGWDSFKRFPVWFYNLPPITANPPTADDRPPYVTLKMTAIGFIDAREPGSLDLQVGRSMPATMVVDGRPADTNGEFAYRIDVGEGLHLVQIETTLHGNEWRFTPSWNQQAFGARGFPLATVDRPLARDRGLLRPAIGSLSTGLSLALVLVWAISAIRSYVDWRVWTWALAASSWLAFIAPQSANAFVTSGLARWSVTALGLSLLVPLRTQLQNLRGAFLLIGIPFLVFIGVAAFDHVGKFSFYAGGDDQWTYQRHAYRIYLQQYWLEGGERTFWNQPGYRWVAGAWHMLFGDSSIGEFHWDGICFVLMALFAFEAVRRASSFRWGIAAAAMVLTLVIQGPPWVYWGGGLSEHAAAGFIYAAALCAMVASTWRVRLAAGVLATFGFYVRLNNLPMALAIAALALPSDVRVRDLWRPRTWIARVDWRTVAWVVAAVATGVFLFTLRTWYFTGHFSFFEGTTMGVNSIYQPGMSAAELARRMADSAWMVLTMNDPPRFVWYAAPLVAAAAISVASLLYVPVARDIPLAIVLLFLAGMSGALVARGVAYSGRFSTIVIASAIAVTMCAVARAFARGVREVSGSER